MASQTDKLTFSVREMAQRLGIGMNNAYALIHRQGFPAIWLTPKKCIIPADGLREWLNKEGGRTNA
jgi:predicted DNA-binding transcriptional regulator AlpA